MNSNFNNECLKEMIESCIKRAIEDHVQEGVFLSLKNDFEKSVQMLKEYKDEYQFEYKGFLGSYFVIDYKKIDKPVGGQIPISVKYEGTEFLVVVVKDEKEHISW